MIISLYISLLSHQLQLLSRQPDLLVAGIDQVMTIAVQQIALAVHFIHRLQLLQYFLLFSVADGESSEGFQQQGLTYEAFLTRDGLGGTAFCQALLLLVLPVLFLPSLQAFPDHPLDSVPLLHSVPTVHLCHIGHIAHQLLTDCLHGLIDFMTNLTDPLVDMHLICVFVKPEHAGQIGTDAMVEIFDFGFELLDFLYFRVDQLEVIFSCRDVALQFCLCQLLLLAESFHVVLGIGLSSGQLCQLLLVPVQGIENSLYFAIHLSHPLLLFPLFFVLSVLYVLSMLSVFFMLSVVSLVPVVPPPVLRAVLGDFPDTPVLCRPAALHSITTIMADIPDCLILSSPRIVPTATHTPTDTPTHSETCCRGQGVYCGEITLGGARVLGQGGVRGQCKGGTLKQAAASGWGVRRRVQDVGTLQGVVGLEAESGVVHKMYVNYMLIAKGVIGWLYCGIMGGNRVNRGENKGNKGNKGDKGNKGNTLKLSLYHIKLIVLILLRIDIPQTTKITRFAFAFSPGSRHHCQAPNKNPKLPKTTQKYLYRLAASVTLTLVSSLTSSTMTYYFSMPSRLNCPTYMLSMCWVKALKYLPISCMRPLRKSAPLTVISVYQIYQNLAESRSNNWLQEAVSGSVLTLWGCRKQKENIVMGIGMDRAVRDQDLQSSRRRIQESSCRHSTMRRYLYCVFSGI